MNNYGYPQLTTAQCESFAVKVQRAWHWANYPPAEQRVIRDRVAQLVARNPGSYLAKVATAVYGLPPTKKRNHNDDTW